MKVLNILQFFTLCLFVYANPIFAEDAFVDSIKAFDELQIEIRKTVTPAKGDCANFMLEGPGNFNQCELKNYCEKFKSELNSPFLVNQNDEQMLNEEFVMANLKLRSCLRGTYKEDIEIALNDFKEQKKIEHLKMVYGLNQQLKKVLTKNNEHSQFAKINREVLSLRLEDSMKGEERSMQDLLVAAQKKLRIKLSKDAVSLVVKIDAEIENPNYGKELKKFERSFFKELILPNKFYDFDNFIDADVAGGEKQLIENQKLYQQKASEVHTEFLNAKQALINYLKQQKTKHNQAMIERAIERVSLVKFHTPVLSDELMKACEFPNAWYNPETQRVLFCPQWFNLPKINLYEILSHELSHAIDPCTFQAPLKISRSKADMINPGPFEVELNLEKLNQSSTLIGELSNQELNERDQKGVTLKDNPFDSMISCLQSKKSIGAIVPSKNELKDKIEKSMKKLKDSVTNYQANDDFLYLKSAYENLDKYYERYGLCNLQLPGGVSQIGEAFADQIAAELVADRLTKTEQSQAVKELDKLILAGMKDSKGICPESKLVKEMKQLGVNNGCREYAENQKLAEKVYRGISLASTADLDEHPAMDDRINKILLSHPKLREILNCPKRGGAKYCEN